MIYEAYDHFEYSKTIEHIQDNDGLEGVVLRQHRAQCHRCSN